MEAVSEGLVLQPSPVRGAMQGGMKTITSTTEQRDHFLALLRKFNSAMLVTATSEGELHARPMAVAAVEDDACVWFITASNSPKVQEIEEDSHVSVTAQDGESCFLALSGRARLVRDSKKIEELWREPFRVWFPNGPSDPTIELIAVAPERGEYWDTTGTRRVSYLWAAAKAYLSQTTPDTNGDEHAKIAL
jgi:general stress protein 26